MMIQGFVSYMCRLTSSAAYDISESGIGTKLFHGHVVNDDYYSGTHLSYSRRFVRVGRKF